MTRILINATHTASTKFNTGIQRVVRRVVQCSQPLQQELGVECIPIQCFRGRIVAVPHIAGEQSWDERAFARARAGLGTMVNSVDSGLAAVSPPVSESVRQLARRCRKALYPRSLVRAAAVTVARLRGREIEMRQGDILLMLDSSWESPPLLYERARQHNCFVAQVVYDLLPITHPQFFAPNIVESFSCWMERAVQQADCFWAISQTVRDTLHDYYQQQLTRADITDATSSAPLAPNRFRSFRLGADLTALPDTIEPRASLRKLFDTQAPVFFSVGTIEPRKNHQWLLAAFDQHWAQGGNAKLVLAGRVGWNSEEIVGRLSQHPRLGTDLHWFQDASDEEVQYMYRHARATAYCSVAEGFGLPIIESLHHGTDVLVSDTPIHREVGKQHVTYCSLESLTDVVDKLNRLASSSKPTARQCDSLVPTWSDCAEQLLRDTLAVAAESRSRIHAAAAERAA